MQLLLLLSAIMAALSGVSGRAVAPQPIERARSASVEAPAAAPAAVAIAVAAIGFAMVRMLLPLGRPPAIAGRVALYRDRRRE